jgi:hypothetical protein
MQNYSIFQCFFELLTRCHKLEKIIIEVHSTDEYKHLVLNNSYVADITSIDPDVIKFSDEWEQFHCPFW